MGIPFLFRLDFSMLHLPPRYTMTLVAAHSPDVLAKNLLIFSWQLLSILSFKQR